MPRRRKSLQQLSDTGALDHDRKRYAGRVQALTDLRPIGDPPTYFDGQDTAIWKELVTECGEGVLAKSDRELLKLTTSLIRRSRLDPDQLQHTFGVVGKHLVALGMDQEEVKDFEKGMIKELTPTAGETRVLMKCLASMGMTPADRSRVVPVRDRSPSRFTGVAGSLAGRIH